ncbi:MAG: serine acetyltransferase [Sulfurimonas sp.]|nr:MAG: serine acetyltransferase [Sulfurimonas sp.]
MLSRVIAKAFGGVWKLKEHCVTGTGVRAKLLRFLYHYYQFEHGSAIAFDASFESAPNFPRGMKQIVVSGKAHIGANCTIFQQVSIDEDMRPGSKVFGAPRIGDNCYIYPGARIIGKVSVGNNVVIGANAVVNSDVPDNTIVSA